MRSKAKRSLGGSSSSGGGRLRLTFLLATVAAFLLIPATQALAVTHGTLTVNIVGTGHGEVTGKGGAALYGGVEGQYEGIPPIECEGPPPVGVCEDELGDFNETFGAVVLKAIPDPGSEMLGWTIEEGFSFGGSFCSMEASTEGTICAMGAEGEENAKVTVEFGLAPPSNLKLNIEEGEGTVVSNPSGLECTKAAPGSCEAAVAEGPVTLTASPAPGYLFKSWKGCELVTGRQCKITATASLKEVGAKFYKVHSLEGSKTGLGIMGTSPGGINCGYACTSSTALYKEGSLTLKEKPAKHFHFVEFTNGTGAAASCNGVTTETCTIANFNEDSAIEEVYAEDAKNTLTLAKEGGGQGFVKTKPTNINCGYTCTAAEATFFASETAEVTVTLNKGTTSVTWVSGAGTCTTNQLTCTVPMSASHSLVAKFE